MKDKQILSLFTLEEYNTTIYALQSLMEVSMCIESDDLLDISNKGIEAFRKAIKKGTKFTVRIDE